MAENSVQLPGGAQTGTRIRTEEVTVNAVVVDQEVVTLAAADGTLIPASGSTLPVSGTVAVSSVGGTTAVSGTVTANAGTNLNTSALALDATLTGGTQKSKLVDSGGTNVATVSAGGALKVDNSAVTQPVSGTVTANAGSGTFTNQQSNTTADYDTGAGTQNITMFGVALPASGGAVAGGTATNPFKVDGSGVTQPVSVASLPALPANQSTNVAQVGGTATDTNSGNKSAGTQRFVIATDQPALTNALKVDGSAVTQPVSGTVTANQGTAAAGSGAWPVTVTDTTNTVVKPGDSGNNAIRVNVVAGGASGGTSSTFGAADPGTGTAAGFSDGTNMREARVFDADSGAGTQYVLGALLKKPASGGSVDFGTNSDPVRVDPTGTTTQPVSGTVTANAGTNLNTSALALETGGNLATVAGAVTASVVQSNTKQMNGVAVTMGNGVSGTGVQRVTLASDSTGQVALAAGAATIGALTANQSVNVAQVAGTTTDTNSGNKSAGTQRVVIATDQPSLTNALPVSQATAANLNATIVGTASDNSADSTAKLPVIAARANASSPSWTEGNQVPLSTDLTGALRVSGASGGGVAQTQVRSSGNAWTDVGYAGGDLNMPVQSPPPASTTMQNAAVANGNGTNLSVAGFANAIVSVTASVGMSGGTTINFEASTDNTTFVPVWANTVGANTMGTTTTVVGDYMVAVAGYSFLRARISAYSAGTITIKGWPATLAGPQPVVNANIVANTATNQSMNLAQVAGTATDTNSGNKSAGTMRMVLATDQPALTNALKVDGSAVTQPVSGTVTSNQGGSNWTVNVAQINGVTPLMGNGVSGTGAQRVTIASDSTGQIALAAGAATIGALTAHQSTNVDQLNGTTTDTNSGTKSAGTLRVVLATDQPQLTNKLLVTPDANSAVNVAQINGVTPLMGNGVSGTGAQRVTIASDSTGQIALAAGAATIGALTANQSVNVNQISGSAVSTAATGVQKVGIVGNTGATVDSTVAAGSAPTNAVAVGAIYNTSAPAPTNGQAMAIQADQAGNQRVFNGIALTTLSAWNSGTALNATQNIYTNSGADAVLLHLVQTTTISGGAITFEVSYDNTNWVTIPAMCVLDPSSATFAQISLPYTLVASTNKPFLIQMNGAQALRIKLSTAITGSATVTPNYALLNYAPAQNVVALSPTAANFNVTLGTGAATIGALSANQSVNNAQVAGTAVDVNSGTKSAGTMRVVLATDQPQLTNKLLVTPDANSAVNVAQINGVTALMGNGVTGTGSQRVTIASDNTAFAVNATLQTGSNTVGNVGLVPQTSGGLSISRTLSAANTTGISVKGSAGQLYGWALTNVNAAARFVKLYNKASAPTVGTDTPVMTILVPGNTAGAGNNWNSDNGIAFGTGIGLGITGAVGDSDTTAPAANEVIVHLFYK